MKTKLIVVTVALTLLVAAGTAMAAGWQSPSSTLSDLTGIAESDLQANRAAGETYGQQAADAGVLAEWQQAMLQSRFDLIDQQVAEGRITAEQGEQLKQELQERVDACIGDPDGSGAGLGMRYGGGLGLGGGCGAGLGGGQGRGRGYGQGYGQGMGRIR
jgi:hypothetical protein